MVSIEYESINKIVGVQQTESLVRCEIIMSKLFQQRFCRRFKLIQRMSNIRIKR